MDKAPKKEALSLDEIRNENVANHLRKIYIPTWKCSRVNRELDEVGKWNGNTLSEKEVWTVNASAALEAAFDVLEDQENVIMVFVRQRGDKGDPIMGLAVTCLSEEQNVEFRIPNIDFPHKVTVVGGKEKKSQ